MAPDATLRPPWSQRIGKITDFVLEIEPLHTTRFDAQEAQGNEIVPGDAIASMETLAPHVTRKVYAYITQRRMLLLFRHPFSPAAGIQVPGGTVEPDEDPSAAVMREAREETGLEDLALVTFLGEAFRTMDNYPDDFAPGEVHHRFFYHLECEGEPPSAWRHHERFATNGDGRPIAFDFYWAALPDDIPPLIDGQDSFIPQLVKSPSRQ